MAWQVHTTVANGANAWASSCDGLLRTDVRTVVLHEGYGNEHSALIACPIYGTIRTATDTSTDTTTVLALLLD